MNTISNELQIGKSGEHFACFDLIRQGFNAFLSDQGLPYDIIVDIEGVPKRLQVKTTQKLVTYERSKAVYRFGLCRGKHSRSRYVLANGGVDGFVFVALDIMKAAYLTVDEMTTTKAKEKKIKQCIDFKSKAFNYPVPLKHNAYNTSAGRNSKPFFEDFCDAKRIF